jgi:hypothetical protein
MHVFDHGNECEESDQGGGSEIAFAVEWLEEWNTVGNYDPGEERNGNCDAKIHADAEWRVSYARRPRQIH